MSALCQKQTFLSGTQRHLTPRSPSVAKSSGRLLNPTQLFLEVAAVIVVALIDDLAVLDPHDGHSVEAKRLAGRRRVRPPGARIGAGEGKFIRDAIRAFDRLARHLPS